MECGGWIPTGGFAVRIETAISLIGIVMEALVHREKCVKNAQKDLPVELLTAAFATLEADDRDTSEAREWLSVHGAHPPKNKGFTYQRRANNQKSAEIEGFIRDLLDRGLTKTAVAKQLGVNRRVVIRVAREAIQSAQQ
jgi:DNA invertase Pin-like site-specific DNA recombinase